MREQAQLIWQEPLAEDWVVKAEARRVAYQVLLLPVQQAIELAWRSEVPGEAWPEVVRQTKRGLLQALKHLTLTPRHPRFKDIWLPEINYLLPSYWEPPCAPEPNLPEHQLQAYRWVSVLIALYVRNALEHLHSRYTGDDCMPMLNRGIRNAVYAALLLVPAVMWQLSVGPRAYIELAARGFPVHIPVCCRSSSGRR